MLKLKNEAGNGLKNKRGTVAMARTSAPHSASSQFFINVVDNDFLNYPHLHHKVGAMRYLVKLQKAWT
jgi:cyclophilin family peptidyl-prolyl cis-trans isomerase